MFRVGQKVVCVDDSGHGGRGLVKGRIYAVTMVKDDGCIQVGFNPKSVAGHCAYSSRRFRPLVERKTSIEVFKKLLNPTPEKVLEIAGCRDLENGARQHG